MNKEEFIEKAKLIHNNNYDYSLVDYINNRTKVKIICNKCGNIFEQIPTNHLRKQGCSNCYGNNLKTKEEFIKKSIEVWGKDRYDYSNVNYINNHTRIKLKCLIHNIDFEQTPKKHYMGQGCPLCLKKSKAEEKINTFLKDNNIDFLREYRFSDCKYKRQLPFDFYLPKNRIAIEYQGIQHFKQQGRGHETLKERQMKDQIKRDYCKNNDILEIEINYFDNLNEKLDYLIKIIGGKNG